MTAKERQKRYRERHREERNAAARARYHLNREKECIRRRIAYWTDVEDSRRKNRIREADPQRKAQKAEREKTEKTKAMRRAYRKKNPRTEYARAYEVAYREERRRQHRAKQENNPQYRLRRTLRSNLKNAIKNKWRGGSAIDNLGCSVDELRSHLESLWQDGMNWSNFGRLSADQCTWQIDHIMPLSYFDLTDPRQVAIACHWTNLAPLWAIDNRRKGNRIVSRGEVSNAFL